MSLQHYITFSIFIICCIVLTYINSMKMVFALKQRDKFAHHLSNLIIANNRSSKFFSEEKLDKATKEAMELIRQLDQKKMRK